MSTPSTAPPSSPLLGDLSDIPWATLFAILITALGGVMVVFSTTTLSFEQYVNYSLWLWGFLAVGRGIASNPQRHSSNPFILALQAIPWANVMVGVLGVTGAVVVFFGKPGALDFDDFTRIMSIALVALGLGNGLRKFKRDSAIVEPFDVDPSFEAVKTATFNAPAHDPDPDAVDALTNLEQARVRPDNPDA
jgi:hypothetical protein